MKVAITGHRPHKLYGYDMSDKRYKPIRDAISLHLNKISAAANMPLNELIFISGMALGIDQIFARMAIYYGAPLIAAVPFLDQELKWNKDSQQEYKRLCAYAITTSERGGGVYLVSEGSYSPHKMQIRNKWMVNQLIKPQGYLIEVWDGSPGGTANCCNYAEKVLNKEQIIRINPKLL